MTATVAAPATTGAAPGVPESSSDTGTVTAGSTWNTVNRLGAALVAVAVAGLV